MVSIEEAKQQIEALRSEIESLNMGYHELREIETIINRTLTAIEHATGSKEIAAAINKLQQFISMVRMAQMTWRAFELATGPLGWIMFGTSVLATAVYVSTTAYEVNAH